MSRSRLNTKAVLFAGPILLCLFFLYDPEPSFTPSAKILELSPRAESLHKNAVVLDLHVDSLIWPRDLSVNASGGHVDFERAKTGGLDGVAMTIPTSYFAAAGIKAFHDLWPVKTWFSPYARFRHQINRMRRYASSHAGIQLTSNPDEMRMNRERGRMSVFHGIEGAHALGRDVERVRLLSELEVAFVAPVHLSDNDFGGTSSPTGRGAGLTRLGHELIRVMNEEGILLDLSHASEATFFEALERTDYPPFVSHSGARAVHDSWRNLSDAQIRAVASRGGVIGVMLAPPGLARPSLDEYIRHLEHVSEVGGEDSVALGSDFDGYVDPPIDVALLPQLTERLIRRGWSDERVRRFLGENALRVLGTRFETQALKLKR